MTTPHPRHNFTSSPHWQLTGLLTRQFCTWSLVTPRRAPTIPSCPSLDPHLHGRPQIRTEPFNWTPASTLSRPEPSASRTLGPPSQTFARLSPPLPQPFSLRGSLRTWPLSIHLRLFGHRILRAERGRDRRRPGRAPSLGGLGRNPAPAPADTRGTFEVESPSDRTSRGLEGRLQGRGTREPQDERVIPAGTARARRGQVVRAAPPPVALPAPGPRHAPQACAPLTAAD